MFATRRRRSDREHAAVQGCLAVVLVVCVAGGAGCDAPVQIDLRREAPRPLRFEEASFFPPHLHATPTGASDREWAYYAQGGGLAVGDIDGDGHEDLFASGGINGHQVFRNLGRGRFEVAVDALPSIAGFVSSATFADVDGDGDEDLILSHLLAERGLTFLRNESGVFVDDTDAAGLGGFVAEAAWSVTFADVDGDDDLDFFVAQWLHWETPEPVVSPHMFCNDGRGSFVDCSLWSGMTAHFAMAVDSSFTATFADLDEDRVPDLLIAADYGRSQVFQGHGDGRFTPSSVVDTLGIDFGMGAVVADFDGDQHFDWFITAIYFPGETHNSNGSRLLLGDGTGGLRDATAAAGVSDGGWAWGVCAADFDLDGDLDIFHVNGYEARPYSDLASWARVDPLKLFLNDGRASFSEVSAELGLVDPGHITATVCADFDEDGDVDIVTLAVGGAMRAYENTLRTERHYVSLDLLGAGRNLAAVGARLIVRADGTEQVRERRVDNTYTSGRSKRLHVGVGAATRVDVMVQWPDGTSTEQLELRVDRHHLIRHPRATNGG